VEHLDHDLQKILASLEDDRGFDIRAFDPGTKINVETCNSVYQIEIVYKSEITIMGGMKSDGEIRFPSPTPAAFVGCTWPGVHLLKSYWIGEQMMMEVFLEDGGLIRTSPIVNVEVEAKDESWSYSLDWNNQNN
jgi:hypothetical protein